MTQPHGIDGRLKVKSFTDPADAFADYGALTDDKGQPVALSVTGGNGDILIVKVEGVDSRNDAETWRGKQFGVVRASMKPIREANTYYIAELIGMDIVDAAGAVLGTAKDVMNFGAGDILELRFANGDTELFAFTTATFPKVDKAAKRITFNRPHILGSHEEEHDVA